MEPEVETFLNLLFKWNKAYALTAFSGPEEAYASGVKPSLLALPLLPKGARVLDVGSGGGFPAVVLALRRPDLRLVLAEPSHVKAIFLGEAARVLKLQYRVEPRTAELVLAADPSGWDAVTVRGVHLRRSLLKKLSRALVPGGVLLAWTGGDRAGQYLRHMQEEGLQARSSAVQGTSLAFLEGHVPRGTSPPGALEKR